jgi:signal transduction histidine kinase
MQTERLEPGLIRLFKIYLGVQLGLILFETFISVSKGEFGRWSLIALVFGVVSIGLLFAYLSWGRLEAKLGVVYLPLAILFAVVIALMTQNLWAMQLDALAMLNNESVWQLVLFLGFLLFVVSWQYDFRAVLIYCGVTAVLDYVLATQLVSAEALTTWDYGRFLFSRTAAFVVIGYFITRVVARERQQQAALMNANQQLAHYAVTLEQLTITQERNRMAREMHDTLAHTLSALAVQLEAVKVLWHTDPDKAQSILDQSLQDTRSGLTETRQAIQALRATPLTDLGLALALHDLAETNAQRAGFTLDLNVPVPFCELSPDVEQCFYRVAQESLENVVRHAGASRVSIQLSEGSHCLNLTIMDDGCGFEPDQMGQNGRFGLRGMIERVEMIGGTLDIESKPGQGTAVCLTYEKPHD